MCVRLGGLEVLMGQDIGSPMLLGVTITDREVFGLYRSTFSRLLLGIVHGK